VESLWVHQGQLAHQFERVLPSGRMQLLVNLGDDELCDYTLDGRPAHRTRGAGLQGPRTAPMLIDTAHQRSICGVSFSVGGGWPFLGVPASEVCGRVVDLSDLWGRDGSVLRERLLEARDPTAQLDLLETALLERATPFDRGYSDVQLACRLLEGGAHVRAVGDRLGLTPRRMINLFRTHVGVPPKLFARLARFQALLRAREAEARWVELAAANGFSDQSHMIREFRLFAGSTPSEHRPRSREATHHVPLSERQFSSIRGHAQWAEFGHDQPSRAH
jgi:AraC-like DNA-binding protein